MKLTYLVFCIFIIGFIVTIIVILLVFVVLYNESDRVENNATSQEHIYTSHIVVVLVIVVIFFLLVVVIILFFLIHIVILTCTILRRRLLRHRDYGASRGCLAGRLAGRCWVRVTELFELLAVLSSSYVTASLGKILSLYGTKGLPSSERRRWMNTVAGPQDMRYRFRSRSSNL